MTEYLPGGSLHALLSQRGRLPVDDEVSIAADVCDGLAAAHAKGIVHRDIKPENILLTADGRAKVGDFGIAHVPRTAGGTTVGGLTQTGFQPGTLIYMSPEQICGEAVDGRSDVYQVDALLYEMLAGRYCIDIEALTRRAQVTTGGNVLRMQARLYDLLEDAICKQEPQDVCSLRPNVPGWLGATVAAALARTAAARPTAEGLAGELRNRKDGHPPEQDTAGHHSVMSVVGGPFGKKTIERPAGAKSSQPDEVIRKDHVAPQTKSDEAEAHFNLGVTYGRQGRLNEAVCELQSALRINPDHVDAHYNLGIALEKQGRLDKAIREFQAALRITPNFAAAHLNLGLVYGQQGRTDEEIREYQTALRIDPSCADAQYNLGVVYKQLGRTAEAIREYQAALRSNPNYADVHHNLGVIYRQLGRTDEAIQEYQSALRIDPDNAEAHHNLGLTYDWTLDNASSDRRLRAYKHTNKLSRKTQTALLSGLVTFLTNYSAV